MIRSIASKVAWVGRTASMVFGLALVMALLLGVATMAFGADGDFFKVGRANVASAVSTLTKSGPGPALSLRVDRGAPLAVNSRAKVANLNADGVDGRSFACPGGTSSTRGSASRPPSAQRVAMLAPSRTASTRARGCPASRSC